MKTLYLMRHAKAGWDDPQQRDYDRPLNPRGEAAAVLMGRFLKAQAIQVDLLLASPAVRNAMTWERLESAWKSGIAPGFEAGIYMASVDTLLALVQSAPPAAKAMMLLGHNPGMEDLSFKLLHDGDAGGMDLLDQGFKTAAIAELTFDVAQWSEITPKSATLQRFITPRSLDRTMDSD
jgi:phosphohistidine phosphatase